MEELLGSDVAPEEDAPQVANPDDQPCIPDPTTGECPEDGSGDVQPEDYGDYGNVNLDPNGVKLSGGVDFTKLFGPNGRGFGLSGGPSIYLEAGGYPQDSYGPLQFDTWGPYQQYKNYVGFGAGLRFGPVLYTKKVDFALLGTATWGDRSVAFDVPGREVDSALARQPNFVQNYGIQLTIRGHKKITPTIDDEPELPCKEADAGEKAKFTAWKAELAQETITVKFNGQDLVINKKEALTKFGMTEDAINSLRVEMRPVVVRNADGSVAKNADGTDAVVTKAVLVVDVVDPATSAKGDAVLMDAQSNPLQPLTLEALRQYVAQNYLFVTKEEEQKSITQTLADLNFVVGKPSASQMDSLRKQITGSTLTDDQVKAMFAGIMQPDSIEALLKTAKTVKDGTLKGRAFELTGHASTDGSASSNLTLSQRRAEAVFFFFWATGIDKNLMKHSGKGETETLVAETGTSAEIQAAREKNRRVEFKLEGTNSNQYEVQIGAEPAKTIEAKAVQSNQVIYYAFDESTDITADKVQDRIVSYNGVDGQYGDGAAVDTDEVINGCLEQECVDQPDGAYGTDGAVKTPSANVGAASAGTSGGTKASAKSAPKTDLATLRADADKAILGEDTDSDGDIDMNDAKPPLAALLSQAELQLAPDVPSHVTAETQPAFVEAAGKTSEALVARRDALKAVLETAVATPAVKFGGEDKKRAYLMSLDAQIAEIEAVIGE
ncbi:MAG: OmpA family protein [Deltaproteobacteria bacterium]|nr:OmpA family protein [Deltaproteobacteria bacterium]